MGTLEEAVSAADHVQESGPEVLETKRSTFAALDATAPAHCVLASSTSAIVASLFTESLPGRARCIVAHPVNPPHLVPVVELCGAPWTSAETKARAAAVMRGVGQVPIDVKREIDGFVLNRLQVALLSEAFRLVQDGVVSPQDLDHTIAHGLGLRWSFMGPFETMDLNAPNGFQDYLDRYRIPYQKMGAQLGVADPWTKEASDAVLATRDSKTPRANLPARRRWRDRRLMALRRQIAQAERDIGD
jgi:3-hydroxyacyl-CoA dehydrogenase